MRRPFITKFNELVPKGQATILEWKESKERLKFPQEADILPVEKIKGIRAIPKHMVMDLAKKLALKPLGG